MDILTRRCKDCKQDKPATREYFYGYAGDRLGIDRRCKACDNARTNFKNAKRNIGIKNGPCADCGGKFHYSGMAFDHKMSETKLWDISNMRGQSREKLNAELAKCDLLCVLCHAYRTWARTQIK